MSFVMLLGFALDSLSRVVLGAYGMEGNGKEGLGLEYALAGWDSPCLRFKANWINQDWYRVARFASFTPICSFCFALDTTHTVSFPSSSGSKLPL